MEYVRIDTDEAGKLAATFDDAFETLPRGTRAVVQKGSLNIKNDARERIGRGGYIGAYGSTIGYETTERPDLVVGEIGPDKDKQVGGGEKRTPGNLGVFLEYEYGTPWSAPKPHLGPALDEEAPRFERALEDLAVRALEGL